ncbi:MULTISPECIES: 2OG-Fe(II) oxygenase [unclassified Sutcliffiella]|uniref:2OG-Fe(II) oxygenase n=1 Tax=unclassified Sutcliffiella TaxID=2837532 RepID=UPI0030D2EEF6
MVYKGKKDSNFIFNGLTYNIYPYGHILVEKVFEEKVANDILNWLENNELWKYNDASNHKSSGFFINKDNLPDNLLSVFSGESLENLLDTFEEIFKTSFFEKFSVAAVKHEVGHGTTIHTDYIENNKADFTHRFIVYLNRDWKEDDGGLFGVFKGRNMDSLVSTIPPLNNSGVGLYISQTSYHAVSVVKNSRRFSLVFSLLSRDGHDNGSGISY